MENVEELYRHYSARLKDGGVKLNGEIKRLSRLYYDRWELYGQATACGIAVASLVNADTVDVANLESPVREAFELAYPNVPIETLATASPEQLAGYVNAWKGKLFEVQVRDQLNSGETVGGIKIEIDHQTAELAASANQPGWDLQILNDDGSVAEEIQLKATESLSYVREALERYPEFHILATNDIANQADMIAGLSIAGVSEEELQQAVEMSFSEVADSDVWDALLPGLPFLLIATRQGLAVFSGESGWSAALLGAFIEGAKSGIAIGGAYAGSEMATELVGELTNDLIGDVAADLLLGAVLPFGLGFFLRKLLGSGNKHRRLREIPAPLTLDENVLRDWILPRALLIQRSVARHYLPPPTALS